MILEKPVGGFPPTTCRRRLPLLSSAAQPLSYGLNDKGLAIRLTQSNGR